MSTDNPVPKLGKGKLGAFLQKKYLGVKGLYWLGIVVAVFAFYAIRMRSSVDDAVTAGDEAAATGTSDELTAGDSVGVTDTVPDLPQGTVTVVQGPGTAGSDLANASITDNTEWVTKGVAYLVGKGISGTAANAALSTYLSGGQISTVQRQYVDMVIKEYGQPPYTGNVSTSTGKRKLVRYVQKAGTSGIYAQYDDNTIYLLSSSQYAALGRPNYSVLPPADIVWTYPRYNSSGVKFGA